MEKVPNSIVPQTAYLPPHTVLCGSRQYRLGNVSQAIDDKGAWWQPNSSGVEDQHLSAADFEHLRSPGARNYTVLLPLDANLSYYSDPTSMSHLGVAVGEFAESLLLHVLVGRYSWLDLEESIKDNRCEVHSAVFGW